MARHVMTASARRTSHRSNASTCNVNGGQDRARYCSSEWVALVTIGRMDINIQEILFKVAVSLQNTSDEVCASAREAERRHQPLQDHYRDYFDAVISLCTSRLSSRLPGRDMKYPDVAGDVN